MTSEPTTPEQDLEFEAMRAVYGALKDLEPAAQDRVLDYVFRRLGLKRDQSAPEQPGASFSPRELAAEARASRPADASASEEPDEALAGVSAVAQKWIRRNGLTPAQLSRIFSLGLETIDVVANAVPGKNKKDKMRSVILLTGTAAYLGTGAARTNYEGVKEALGHYNAYDGANYATYIKEMAAEISGSKESGYTLTARGLAAAAELVKEMTTEK